MSYKWKRRSCFGRKRFNQTANLNSTDSFNLRERVIYGQADWANEGWHLLAGDSWSLVTTNSKGITPRNEVLPPTIDAQYNVGFIYARQPGIRITKDMFDQHLWVAVAAEQSQTTLGGSVPTGTTANIANGQNYYAGDTGTLTTTTNSSGAVTAVSGVATATQSINHIPDIIGKVAVEEDVFGHHVHGEVFGLYRSFYEQLATLKTNNVNAGSVGGAVSVQVVPNLLDAQVSGMTGNGIGRYGTSGLPDVAFLTSGKISAIQETAALFGATLHATKMTDIYLEGGEEHQVRPDSGHASYGNFTAVNTGCNLEGSALACTGNTRMITELSGGLWQKLYSGPWGYARVGLQYSYIDREAFGGVGGAPTAKENMIYTSIRYYPF